MSLARQYFYSTHILTSGLFCSRALLVPLVPMVKAMVITINAGVIELRPLVCGLYMQTSICFLLHEKRKKSVALLTRLREQMNRV